MPRQAKTAVPTRATAKEWLGLSILGLISLVVAIDLFVMLMALPTLSKVLHVSATQQLWITDMYGFMLAGFLITMGTLGDRIGRRKVLMIGSAAFALSSLLVAFSPNAGVLILARALLGVAGATLAPTTLALITHMFKNARQRATAISIFLCCLIGGSAVGPLVGGVMLNHFWWGSVFLIGIPPMILALLFGRTLLPEYRDPDAKKLHFPSVFLSLAAILPTIYGIKELAVHGWQTVPAIVFAAGVIFGVLFVRQQKRLIDPLVDISLFKKPIFSITLLAMLANTMLPGGVMVLITQYLQLVSGLSPQQAGLWMIPAMAFSAISFVISPFFARRIRPAYLIAAGILVSVAGLLVLTQAQVHGLSALIVGFALFNLGAGPLVTLGTGIIISSVPPQKAGGAAAISQTANEFGFALGIAVVGSLGAAVYRSGTVRLPAHTSSIDAASIRETLAGAINTAQHLPGDTADSVVQVARNAFVHELHSIALVSAVVLLLIAVVIAVKLRSLPVISDTDHS
jgi:DHA2 family multidrug resistance protein-like MFS transporter